jgi:YtcA family
MSHNSHSRPHSSLLHRVAKICWRLTEASLEFAREVANIAQSPSSRVGVVASSFALGGCDERVPSINVLGAFFPAWMLCIIAGIVATVVARRVLVAIGLDPWLGLRGVVYPALALAFMLATWIAFFQN